MSFNQRIDEPVHHNLIINMLVPRAHTELKDRKEVATCINSSCLKVHVSTCKITKRSYFSQIGMHRNAF